MHFCYATFLQDFDCGNVVHQFKKHCKVAYYPELYSEGLLPLHNKFILSFDLILDFYNQLVTGSSLIENVEAKFLLLGKCNGFEEDDLLRNLSNHSKNIEKFVIATIASLINGADLNEVMCNFYLKVQK